LVDFLNFMFFLSVIVPERPRRRKGVWDT